MGRGTSIEIFRLSARSGAARPRAVGGERRGRSRWVGDVEERSRHSAGGPSRPRSTTALRNHAANTTRARRATTATAKVNRRAWFDRHPRSKAPPAGRSMSGCGSGGPSVRPAAGCGMGPRPSPPATRTTAATGAHVHTCVAVGSSRCVDPVSSGGARQAWVMVRSADQMLSRPSRAPGCLVRTTQGRTRPG